MAVMLTLEMVTVECCNCHLIWQHSKEFNDDKLKNRHNDRGRFYCPAGHRQHYLGKTDEQKLRDELALEKHRAEQARADAAEQRAHRIQAERRVRGHKAVNTRMKNRIARGKCACCSREFADLAAHMKRQHPDWNPEKGAEAIAAKTP